MHAAVRDGTIEVAEGPATEPDTVLEADLDTYLAWGVESMSDAMALNAGMRVTGGRRTLRRLFGTAFPDNARADGLIGRGRG